MRRRHLCTIGLLAGVLLGEACGGDTPAARTATGDGDGAAQYEGTFTVLESPDHGPQLCSFVATSLPPQCGGPDIEGWDWDAVDGEESAAGVTWGDYHVTGTFADGRFTPTAPVGPPDRGDGADQPAPDFSPACDEPEVTDPAQGIPPSGVMEDAPDLVASWISNPGTDWDGQSLVVNLVVLPGSGAATRDLVRQSYGGALCVVEREGATLAELAGIQAELFDGDATEHLGEVQSAGPDGIIGKVRATVWVADGPALDYAQQRWGDLVQLEGLLQPTS